MIGLVAVSAKAMERAAAVGREQSHSDRHPPAALTGASQEPEEAPRQEALAWFVRLHSGEAGAGDFAAHAEWLAKAERAHGIAEVIIGKQRHGPTGTVKLMFDREHTRFHNLDIGHAAGDHPV